MEVVASLAQSWKWAGGLVFCLGRVAGLFDVSGLSPCPGKVGLAVDRSVSVRTQNSQVIRLSPLFLHLHSLLSSPWRFLSTRFLSSTAPASSMATAGDGSPSCDNGGTREKFRKRILRPEINEEPQIDSKEAGRNNSKGASEVSTHQGGISELEQMLKQLSFTRSEAERLMALVHSRIMEEPPSPVVRLETSSTSGSLKRHKHGDESDNFHAAIVLKEDIVSRAELANACKGSPIGQALGQYSKLISNIATSLSKTPMASPPQPVTMENLPNELLSNIFIRLLAKQLAQMRSVSKSWNALLSQSSFINSHLHCSIKDNEQILLVFYYYQECFPDFKPFAAYSSRPPHLELTNFIKLPVNPQPEHTNGFMIIGHVHGLICSCYGDSIIHIWNPSLSAVLTLPPYSMPSRGDHPIKITFRFGFDPKTNDYKVVKLTGLIGPFKNIIKWWLDVEIYSMRKGTWELITARFPSHIKHIVDDDYVCVDGHDGRLHWLGCTNDEVDIKTIVAFDLSSETFCELHYPDSIKESNRQNELGVLSGKLCVTSELGTSGVIEVWVMEEYGVAESWVKRYVFSEYLDSGCTFGFTSHNEYVIQDDGFLVFYDPIAKKRKKALEDYCPEEYGVHRVVEYVDSLVWVTPGRGQN